MGWQKELMEAVESDDYDWVRDIMDDERSRQKSLAKQEGRVLEDLCIPHVAATNGQTKILYYFIAECGVPMDLVCEFDHPSLNETANLSLLQAAVIEEQADTVAMLVEIGVDVEEETDDDSLHSIFYAAEKGYTDILEIFIEEADVSPNKERIKGRNTIESIMEAAVKNGRQSTAAMLADKGAKVKPGLVCTAATKGEDALIRFLVYELRADQNEVSDGFTPLGCAIREKKTSTVKTLIDMNADTQVRVSGKASKHRTVNRATAEELITAIYMGEWDHWRYNVKNKTKAAEQEWKKTTFECSKMLEVLGDHKKTVPKWYPKCSTAPLFYSVLRNLTHFFVERLRCISSEEESIYRYGTTIDISLLHAAVIAKNVAAVNRILRDENPYVRNCLYPGLFKEGRTELVGTPADFSEVLGTAAIKKILAQHRKDRQHKDCRDPNKDSKVCALM